MNILITLLGLESLVCAINPYCHLKIKPRSGTKQNIWGNTLKRVLRHLISTMPCNLSPWIQPKITNKSTLVRGQNWFTWFINIKWDRWPIWTCWLDMLNSSYRIRSMLRSLVIVAKCCTKITRMWVNCWKKMHCEINSILSHGHHPSQHLETCTSRCVIMRWNCDKWMVKHGYDNKWRHSAKVWK